MPLNAPKEEVEVHFDQVRALLLGVMMGALDSYPYELSWNTLTHFGDPELNALLDMKVASPTYCNAVAHLKELVESAMATLP